VKESEEIFRQKTDYKRLILKFLGYKYYFIAVVVVAVVIAYIFNKYSSRIYNNWTTILINEEQPNSFLRSDEIMASGLFTGIENVENELAILKSFNIVNAAVQEMNFEVDYFYEENIAPVNFIKYITKTDLYTNSPIKVIIDQTHLQPVNTRFYVEIFNDSTYKISASNPRVGLYNYIINDEEKRIDNFALEGIFKFGEKVESDNYSFSLYLTEYYNPALLRDKKLFFQFNDLNLLSLIYSANLSISTTTQTSSVVIISLNGYNPIRITDFLNTLTRVYLEKNLEKKNKQAFNTIKFIDARISDIADSLFFAENKLQNFRSRNQVMDLSFQGEQLYERMNQLENEKTVLVMQQRYYDYIREYFNSNNDVSDLMAPSAMDVRDPTLSQLIGELMDLNNQRMNYMLNNPKNLFLKDLEIQISNLKKTILENIQYSYRKAEIDLEDIDSRIAKLNTQITMLPRTERELIGMERQFKLNDAIYTFLLQKRAEAQIARASNFSDYEIVNDAQYFNARVISPNTQMNYIIAAFLGLMFPFSIILIRDFLNNKITDIKEIEEMSSLPLVGQIFHSRKKSKAIIMDYPKSPIADSFRAIRTNLQFFAKGSDKMVILLTSTISGEGKSFCSVNLASVYALLGKKTLLLGFDLRRPSLYQDFNLNNEKGITSYLINKMSVDEIIQKTKIENLDLISAGPIPPNPMELIASEKTAQFFEELKKKYDYIIIDSAPLGAIADSFLLFEYSDINIVVIRHNVTVKEAIKMNLKNIESKGVKNVTLLINDIKLKKNAYGYAYQSKYYNQDSEKFSINKVLKKGKKVNK
jgi:capsular exopolysaccharide synthesis family protein